MVNQAVEMHEQRRLGGLQVPRFRIASDTNNVSLIKLDVEKVRQRCPYSSQLLDSRLTECL